MIDYRLVQPRFLSRFFVCFVTLAVSLPLFVIGEEVLRQEIPIVYVTELDEQNVRSAECGVYAMAMALAAKGSQVKVEPYLNQKFVSNVWGSSPEQLIEMARLNGIEAQYADHVSWLSLKRSRVPVLLLLRERDTPEYLGHWVAFLGMNGEMAEIFDSAGTGQKTKLIPPADFLVNWHGQAIFLDTEEVLFSRYASSLVFAILPLLFIVGLGWLVSAKVRTNTIIIPAVLSITATIWYTDAMDNVLFHPGSYTPQFLTSKYYDANLPETTLTEVLSEFKGQHIHLVDARDPRDFRRSHLQNSVNLHVKLTMHDLRDSTGLWKMDEVIVVYCSGSHCGWGPAVARRLAALGFSRVYVSRESIEQIVEQIK